MYVSKHEKFTRYLFQYLQHSDYAERAHNRRCLGAALGISFSHMSEQACPTS